MAVRTQIDTFSEGEIRGEVQYDGGMAPGGEHFMIVFEGENRIFNRTWYWGSYDSSHAKNFVQKLARDDEYRMRCKAKETTWAKIQVAYSELWPSVFSVYEPLGSHRWGDMYGDVNDLAEKHCRRLYEQLAELYETVGDPTWESAEEVAKSVKQEAIADREELKEKYSPHPPEHRITFGKHEGKTLREIAEKHPGYAEWGVEELDNRPKVRRGLNRLLDPENDL
jgi:hypothetical protein